MKPTGHFHYEVTNTTAVQANTVLDDTQALHSANCVVYAHPASGVHLVDSLLLIGQFTAARFLDGLLDLDPINREGQKAKVLEQDAALRQLVVSEVGNALVRHSALLRTTQVEHAQERIHEKEVFDRVEALLAAVVAPLVFLVDRARDGSFGAIVSKRGGDSCSVVCSCSSASGSCSKRFINSPKLRAGASPSAQC